MLDVFMVFLVRVRYVSFVWCISRLHNSILFQSCRSLNTIILTMKYHWNPLSTPKLVLLLIARVSVQTNIYLQIDKKIVWNLNTNIDFTLGLLWQCYIISITRAHASTRKFQWLSSSCRMFSAGYLSDCGSDVALHFEFTRYTWWAYCRVE